MLREHTAGDPMRPEVRWTNLSLKEMSRRPSEQGTPASKRVLRPLLKKRSFVKRKAHQTLAMGGHPDRDAQFQNIAKLKQEFLDAGQPVLSTDTKKKELLGTFYRDGKLYSRDEVRVYDHDFPSCASGTVIPYGIYDLAANQAHVTLGTSHDTSEFACECLALWWEQQGRDRYPTATTLLLLCDGEWQQRLEPTRLQGSPATLGRPSGHRDSSGSLPAVLFEVQSHRTSRLPACDSRLPRRGV